MAWDRFIKDLVDPTDAQDAATKAYVDAQIGSVGQIYLADGTGNQTPGTSYTVMNQWHANGADTGDVTADYTGSKLTISEDGLYKVSGQFSFGGTNSAEVAMRVYRDTTAIDQISLERKLGTSGDVGSASLVGLMDATGTPNDVQVWVKCVNGAHTVDMQQASLTVERVGDL